MKILILCNTLNKGGAERVGVCIANGLARLGHDITLFAKNEGEIVYKPENNVKIVWFNKIAGHRILTRFRIFKQLYRYLKANTPDVIIEIMHVFSHELLLAKKISGCKASVILSEHFSFERPVGYPMPMLSKYHKWILNKLFDHITVLTQADKEYIGDKLKNVTVMYNPLFLNPVEHIPKKKKQILSVGRLDAWAYKGFDILIEAWNRIAKKYPDWKLKIVGDGSEEAKKYLSSLSNGNPQIVFEDFKINIEEEYKSSEIFCLSSRYEGWGLVAIEAMSQGCATIACNYNGRQAEFITDGFNGLLSTPDDTDALTEKIECLINNVDFRDEIKNNAPKSLHKFSIPKVTASWDKLIHEVSTINKLHN